MNNSQNYLILGGSSDLGCGFISSLPASAHVFCHYNRSLDKIRELTKHVSCRITPIQADLLDDNANNCIIEAMKDAQFTPGKILHLAAPKYQFIRFCDLSWVTLQKEIDIQVKSLFGILKHLLPQMAADKYGKIVVMLSSVTTGVPPKFTTHYTTAKYALLGIIRALTSEYAQQNIQINAVSPSIIETSFHSEIPQKILDLAREKHPLKRNASPADIIPLLQHLLSDNNTFITGNNICASGGEIF